MIHASRTAFVENPDGSIQCVITIPRAERGTLLDGEPIVCLSPLPRREGDEAGSDSTMQATIDAVIERGMRGMRDNAVKLSESTTLFRPEFDTDGHGAIGIDPDEPGLLSVTELRERAMNKMRNATASACMRHLEETGGTLFGVDLAGDAQAECAGDRPPAQTVGVGGFDSAQVVEAVTSGEYTWDHPAAPHMANIFRHKPFQQFAMMKLHADAFAAPMECATRFITKAVKGKPMDAAVAALSQRMDEYMAWAKAACVPAWPRK